MTATQGLLPGGTVLPPLDRAVARAGPPAPVRVVHIGLGAFFRAHQAWYTHSAADGWGIAAVTGRSDGMVARLGGQGGVYTLLVRGPDADRAEVVASVSEVVGHADARALELLASPAVSVVTMTVTEAGYQAGSAVVARLVAGMERRRRAGAGPIALVSCDNLAGNGVALHDALLSATASPGLASWVDANCAFPSTVVDRITPATTTADTKTVGDLKGWYDQSVVVTEPWSEWVLEDSFPAGRPAWEASGAQLVADVSPYEQRKLRFLNAGHSLLAYMGLARGYRYVHEALADEAIHDALLALWAESRPWMSPAALAGAEEYCITVEHRWANSRLPHTLAQIASDGSLKLRQRLVPTVLAARAAGAAPDACAVLLGAWVAHVRRNAAALVDPQADVLRDAAGGVAAVATTKILAVLDTRLAEDRWAREATTQHLIELEKSAKS